jgi:hypothetical protein
MPGSGSAGQTQNMKAQNRLIHQEIIPDLAEAD